MKLLKEFSRFFVGILFIISGLIKVNDPVGTAIKLEEYFQVFAYDFAPFFEVFVPAALFFSVFLSVLEVVLGFALLLNYQTKINSWILLLLIIFFSFLTFYSAYFNKVTDCGCFGDAIKFTPWQSFTKDMVLLFFIGIIFLFKNDYKSVLPSKTGLMTMSATTIVLIILAVIAIRHLPFIDFRTYKIGNNLGQLMQPSGELEYEYIMEKDGETFRFDSYPSDKSYTFKEMVILNPEVQPKITDLAVWNDDGEFTEQLLSGAKLLLITHSIEKSSLKNISDINALFDKVEIAEKWSLTASGPELYDDFAEKNKIDYPYFFADATVLKTMVRSNPGIILLKDGVVKGKWHFNDVPTVSEINRLLYE
jgi:uncharacterized membrane protein YphA (DoxX/SURF4 family)